MLGLAQKWMMSALYLLCIQMCIYIYMNVWRYAWHNSSTCHAYVMWEEFFTRHSHFLYIYMPAVSNVVTTGNGTGTKNVVKGTVHLGLGLVSSLLSMVPLL